jgi:hydroxymethylpyrimidine pyrophosphatase-like HAD family hydrolase
VNLSHRNFVTNSDFLIFTDLDDTLISTTRKTNFSKNVETGAFGRDGKPSSHIYSERLEILKSLQNSFKIIPTTARTFESYRRTIFWKDFHFGDAVLNFSGTLIQNGEVDRDWESEMKKRYKSIPNLKEIRADFQNFVSKNMGEKSPIVKNIENFYINIYNKSFRENKKISSEVENLVESFKKEQNLNDFYIYKNDASFALIPNFLNKSVGVQHLIDQFKPKIVFGAGDNTTDFPFMELSDFYIIPKNSQLDKKLKESF